MRWACLAVVLVACSGEGSPPPDSRAPDAATLGPAPTGCDEYVDSGDECGPVEDICRPDICAGFECCFVEGNEWRVLITDCFEGCPWFSDAGVDAN